MRAVRMADSAHEGRGRTALPGEPQHDLHQLRVLFGVLRCHQALTLLVGHITPHLWPEKQTTSLAVRRLPRHYRRTPWQWGAALLDGLGSGSAYARLLPPAGLVTGGTP